MRRRNRAVWCGLAAGLVAGLAVGCDLKEEKMPEKAPPRPTATATGKGEPAATDPAGKAVIDKAVAAHTGGRPELLEKAKVHRSAGKSQLFLAQGEAEGTRAVEAVWPDFYAQTVESSNPAAIPPGRFVVSGPQRWFVPKGQPAVSIDPIRAQEPVTDQFVVDWVSKLVPLADPAVKFGPPRAGTANGLTTTVVRCVPPAPPALDCHFDTGTGLLVQVEYEARPDGRPLAKVVRFLDHKPTAGLVLPSRYEAVHGGRLVERSEFQSYEFPDRIDPKAFQP